jgi:hypothetical protein
VSRLSRRALLKAGLAAANGAALLHLGFDQKPGVTPAPLDGAARRAAGFPVPAAQWHGDSSVGAAQRTGSARIARFGRSIDADFLEPVLRERELHLPISSAGQLLRARFPHLRRHFVFEYYPWYQTAPYVHWSDTGYEPPFGIAATTMPHLGPYSSADPTVIAQHARWMAEMGVGAIAISWWGRGSFEDRTTPLIMDIMRDHDIHVTFHMEPYADNRALTFADDVLYVLREYGERRNWDNFLLLENADGTSAPVIKGFRTILPPTVVDCTGTVQTVPDYHPDAVWRQQTDLLREATRSTFDRITLLADSLDVGRTRDAGFDGMAIYDSYVRPSTWAAAATNFGGNNLLYSFAINCGFDGFQPIVPRHVCDIPLPFEPPVASMNWNDDGARIRAQAAAYNRVLESFDRTLVLQADPARYNSRRGFFLTYVNTFNEWHEGTAFEPARHRRDLRPEEAEYGYHNPVNGAWRMELLQSLLRPLTADR